MKPETIFEISDLAFPIRLVQTGIDRFRVEYGKQVDTGNYETATRKLGEAILHALACDGRITEAEDEPEDEREDFETDCPACGGHAYAMGALGWQVHFRCRDCGSQWPQTIERDNARRVAS